MATTHEEIYRPFEGEIRGKAPRFWPVFTGTLRVATKKKIPLLFLYVVPAIATVMSSALVYIAVAAQQEPLPDSMGGPMATLAVRQVETQLEIRNQIFSVQDTLAFFALLAAAWFGGGLICDDRRVGAHQLYFCRPLSRFDYFLGKFLGAAFFAALASMAPSLIICLVAAFASPGWSFLTEQWDVPLRSVAYSSVWITMVVSIILAASSIAPRKSFALVGIFAVFLVTEAVGNFLGTVQSEEFYLLSLARVIETMSAWIFLKDLETFPVDPNRAWMVIGAVTVFSLAIVGTRLRRLEVVG